MRLLWGGFTPGVDCVMPISPPRRPLATTPIFQRPISKRATLASYNNFHFGSWLSSCSPFSSSPSHPLLFSRHCHGVNLAARLNKMIPFAVGAARELLRNSRIYHCECGLNVTKHLPRVQAETSPEIAFIPVQFSPPLRCQPSPTVPPAVAPRL